MAVVVEVVVSSRGSTEPSEGGNDQLVVEVVVDRIGSVRATEASSAGYGRVERVGC